MCRSSRTAASAREARLPESLRVTQVSPRESTIEIRVRCEGPSSSTLGGTVTLPSFLVIGAARSATTSLHYALRAHPQVFVPERKEPNFFAFEGLPADADPGVATSVTRLEDYVRLFQGVTDEEAIGEVSPVYLVNPRACERIHTHIPEAKLIAVLRNPIERAYSDYLMRIREGLEPLRDFGRALAEEEARHRVGHPGGYYIRTGFYGRQLRPYFNKFGADHIQVHLFEDVVANPDDALASIFGFLGVNPDFRPGPLLQTNVSGVPRNAPLAGLFWMRKRFGALASAVLPLETKRRIKALMEKGLDRPPLLPEHREELVDVYRDDVRELEKLLGRSLEHWLAC
jgi:Sulfotransferase family